MPHHSSDDCIALVPTLQAGGFWFFLGTEEPGQGSGLFSALAGCVAGAGVSAHPALPPCSHTWELLPHPLNF